MGFLFLMLLYAAISVFIVFTVHQLMHKETDFKHWLKSRKPRIPPTANSVSPDDLLILTRHETGTGNPGGASMSKVGLFSRIARAISGDPALPQPPVPAAPAVPPVIVDYEDDRIPEGAKEKVRRILACLKEVEELMARESVEGFTRVDVQQMLEQHLPKLVKSYIDIPPAHRSEIFRKTGKSASYVLEDSLEQMQTKIDDIMRNLAQHDLDAFADNTRFIKERYTNTNPFD